MEWIAYLVKNSTLYIVIYVMIRCVPLFYRCVQMHDVILMKKGQGFEKFRTYQVITFGFQHQMSWLGLVYLSGYSSD